MILDYQPINNQNYKMEVEQEASPQVDPINTSMEDK